MAGPFYLALVGGAVDPEFRTIVTGSVWGGSLETSGDTWGGELTTTGDLMVASNVVQNVRDVLPLVEGLTYFIQGPGIPQANNGDPTTTFTYTGGDSITMSAAVIGVIGAGMANASLKISSTANQTHVGNLAKLDGLIVGETYAVSGGGAQPGTTATYAGGDSITLSLPATQTAWQNSITLSNPSGRDVVVLDSTVGLTTGRIYEIQGPGIPNGNFFEFTGSSQITITQPATLTKSGGFFSIFAGRTEDDGGAFDASTMLVESLDVFDFELHQAEGDCCTLDVTIENPQLGLLRSGAPLWCWLSWDSAWIEGVPTNPSNAVALFHGRIVGAPQLTANEIVRLQFIAKPLDFLYEKAVLSAALRVLPYVDPIFLQAKLYDPDTALEAYSALYHVDRLSLAVTTSDIISGEDGTITIDGSEALYNGFDLSYGQAPLQAVSVAATVTWTQSGSGEVDLTETVVDALRSAGSPFDPPLVGTYTTQGLEQSWPKPFASFAGGWTVSADASAVMASWVNGASQQFTYIDKTDGATDFTPYQNTGLSTAGLVFTPYTTWYLMIPIYPMAVSLKLRWDAARDRSETMLFTLATSTQAILTDPGTVQGQTLSVSSDTVAQPVDLDGSMPLGDTRRNSYFLTDRGEQSLQNLLLLARARLLSRARCVTIKFEMSFEDWIAKAITLRKNATISDYRIPGGTATGKIVAYTVHGGGDGQYIAEVHVACAIGYGIPLGPAPAPTETYADNYADDYTTVITAVDLISGSLQYDPPQGAIDDDGVDLFNMVPDTVVLQCKVYNGLSQQAAVVAAAVNNNFPDPISNLNAAPTEIRLDLQSVVGGAFHTDFMVATQDLVAPQGINLEAT